MRRSPLLLTPLLILILGCAPSEEKGDEEGEELPELQKLRGDAQGSTFSIKYASEDSIPGLEEKVDSVLELMDRNFSMYVDSSGVLDFQEAEKGICMSGPFQDLYRISREVHERTHGAFDPTVKPLVDAWGFGPNGEPEEIPERLDSLLERVGLEKLREVEKGDSCRFLRKARPDMAFDPNAVAQGYTVDRLALTLQNEFDVERAMIELGGEVRTLGKKGEGEPWRIGIDEPREPGEGRAMQAIVGLEESSIATSGSYRKFYEKEGKRYPHTIDPRTGKPVQHQLLSVTVKHPSCTHADAYATAFMVLGAEKADSIVAANPQLDAYFIMGEGEEGFRSYATKGMKEILEERP